MLPRRLTGWQRDAADRLLATNKGYSKGEAMGEGRLPTEAFDIALGFFPS
jgi:hypothetical protein